MPCLESTCSIFSTYTALISDSDLSNETNKRTSLHCKPLTRSKNEDKSKITTLLQITLCGQISPIKKEENTPSSPIVCIHCRQLLFLNSCPTVHLETQLQLISTEDAHRRPKTYDNVPHPIPSIRLTYSSE